jgi:ATP-dependent Lhr-like helicase
MTDELGGPGLNGDGSNGDGLSGGGHAEGAVSAAEEAVRIGSEDVEELVIGALGGSALFSSRFRENAARALLLPRRRAGQRTPLWQLRQRSAQLLSVASRYGSFPIILETYRECLQDVFDLPALRGILGAIERREIRLVSVETRRASPFASSLMFDYIASYMYEGDAPLVDRRAQALALDRDLLRELLGAEELRELMDAEALAELELELQFLSPDRGAGSADAVHDLLRRLGDLRADEVAARVRGPDERAREAAAGEWLEALAADRRAVVVRIRAEERWIAMEDVARYRDALGVNPPLGVPQALLAPCVEALSGLLTRWARHHGPFLATEPATRWGLPIGDVDAELELIQAAGTILRGEFRPDGVEREWCHPDVLRLLRRRSLARLRREIEPVEPQALARFLPRWQGVGERRTGIDRLAEVIAQLEGTPLPASVLERDVLPARVAAYSPRLLDELGAAGEVVWIGLSSLGRDDGRVALYRPDRLPLLLNPVAAAEPPQPTWLHDVIRAHLVERGASFYRDLLAAALRAAAERGERPVRERDLLDALWDLVWMTEVTNDTFAPLRALRWPRSGSSRRSGPGPAGPRPRFAATARMGPPEAAGRWSLVSEAVATANALRKGQPPSETERRHAHALRLLDAYGVVTRDTVAGEGLPGGFSGVYPVLREMEERGRVGRGYFVEGLGGAQFCIPAALDRLRAERSDASGDRAPAEAMILAASDPANPYGAALAWPRWSEDDRRPLPRAAGAYVVLIDGEPALYLERGGKSLQTLPAFADREIAAQALSALRQLVADGRYRSLQIERVDGGPVGDSPHAPALADAGFQRAYRGWLLKA